MAPIYKGDTSIMRYEKRLKPWIVVRLLPNLQRVVVVAFAAGQMQRVIWEFSNNCFRLLDWP